MLVRGTTSARLRRPTTSGHHIPSRSALLELQKHRRGLRHRNTSGIAGETFPFLAYSRRIAPLHAASERFDVKHPTLQEAMEPSAMLHYASCMQPSSRSRILSPGNMADQRAPSTWILSARQRSRRAIGTCPQRHAVRASKDLCRSF